MKMIIFIFILIFAFNTAHSQTNDTETYTNDPEDKWSIGFSLMAGKGDQDNFIAMASKYNEWGNLIRTEEIEMGGGGGKGIGLILGYNIFSRLEISFQYTYLNRGLTPDPDDAEGDFKRHIIQGTLFGRIIRFTDNTYLKIGGGMGIYFPGEYVIDLSESGGSRHVFKVDTNHGIHYAVEFELQETGAAVFIGVQRYKVFYNSINSSEKLNGDGFSAYFGVVIML